MSHITPATAHAARLLANKLVTRRNRLYTAYQAMKGQVCEDVLEKAARALATAETQSTAAMMEDQFQQECLAARAAAPAPATQDAPTPIPCAPAAYCDSADWGKGIVAVLDEAPTATDFLYIWNRTSAETRSYREMSEAFARAKCRFAAPLG